MTAHTTLVTLLPDRRASYLCPHCRHRTTTALPVAGVGALETLTAPAERDVRGRLRWTAAEDQLIRQLYPQGGWALVQPHLAHRTANAIIARANKIGALFSSPHRDWTAEQLQILQQFYPARGARYVSARTGHTPNSIYVMAGKLGIVSRRRSATRALREEVANAR